MPQIIVKGLDDAQMCALSTPLLDRLADAIGCPADWLVLEQNHATFYGRGEKTPGFPIVEVQWYDRPAEVQEAVAQIIKEELFALGFTLVQVIFVRLAEEIFYEFEV